MIANERPIGIFDSGMGGLTVLKEIMRTLPGESTVYYADAAHCPYGEKSREEVIRHTEQSVSFLMECGVKLIVIACNTASSSAVHYLREHFEMDFVAMEPAVKPAATTTRTGVVGILATRRTIEGEPLKALCRKWEGRARFVFKAGCGLVEFVEEGREKTPEAQELVERYIGELLAQGVDRIVLGCTHYPFLYESIKNAIGDRDVRLIDPAPAIAVRVRQLLEEKGMLNATGSPATHDFYSSAGENYVQKLRERLANSFAGTENYE